MRECLQPNQRDIFPWEQNNIIHQCNQRTKEHRKDTNRMRYIMSSFHYSDCLVSIYWTLLNQKEKLGLLNVWLIYCWMMCVCVCTHIYIYMQNTARIKTNKPAKKCKPALGAFPPGFSVKCYSTGPLVFNPGKCNIILLLLVSSISIKLQKRDSWPLRSLYLALFLHSNFL